MAESVAYTVPQYPAPAANSVEVIGVELRRKPEWLVRITVQESNGRIFDVYYRNTEEAPTLARDLVTALNKANLSTKSLERRALERLLADGHLSAGTVTGSPE